MKQPEFFARTELRAALWALRREFVVVGLFSAVANLLMLTPTIYMMQIYDRVMLSRSEMTLLAISLITLFLFAVMAFTDWSRSRLLVRAGVRLDELLGTRAFTASFESHLGQSSANPTRALADLAEMRQFLTGHGIFAFFDAPWTPIYIGVQFVMHPVLGWVSILFALIQAGLAWLGHYRTVALVSDASRAQREVMAYLQGKLRNAEVLEAMGMIGHLQQRWNERQQDCLARIEKAQGATQRVMGWSKFIRYSQQSLSLGVGAMLVINNELSVGAMIAVNLLMTRALAPIDLLVSTWRGAVSARGALGRLEALLAAHPERDAALARVPPTGDMTLRDVVATAKGRAEPILKSVSLDVAAGTVTVVLGPSGSGKSTLALVMVGIWPEVAGEVLLDGRPIGGWNRAELGPNLGYLPQDVELFDGTIAENIARFGAVNPAGVIAATRAAGLHETILHFPKGYDTEIGEAGHLLSGGQRQRIGLARAMYGDPALIVLDEPNANLDEAGEAALLKTVRDLRARGQTVILVTHRPQAVSLADRIVILREGRVQADGPRDAVLAALKHSAGPTAQPPALPLSA